MALPPGYNLLWAIHCGLIIKIMPSSIRRHYAIMKRHRRTRRGTYVPQERRIATVQRPLASKYGDEIFIKVQKVLPLETQDAIGSVFAYMR